MDDATRQGRPEDVILVVWSEERMRVLAAWERTPIIEGKGLDRLARCAGVSTGSASQAVAALRDAGLIFDDGTISEMARKALRASVARSLR